MKEHNPYGPYERYFKRPLDIICASLAIIVFAWLYLIVAVMVMINLGRPVLFKQQRPGKNELLFTIYKFRTMTNAKDKNNNLLPEEVRLTKFGSFLRKTSLDELPEAWNILTGKMSVVGPRPLLEEYLPLYSEEQKSRHSVRPGLTGLAQINGRNTCSWNDRFLYDIQYVERITFCTDLKIVFYTIFKAFIKREGISSETSVTMEKFRGNEAI